MKTLSYWASKNILAARLVLTLAYLTLAASAIFIGLLWAYKQVYFPGLLIFFFILAGLTIGILKYPNNKHIKENIRYGKQYFRSWKVYDLALVIPLFLIALSIGHNIPAKDASAYPVYQAIGYFTDFDPGLKVLNLEKEPPSIKARFFKRINRINKQITAWSYNFFNQMEEKGSAGWIWLVIVLLAVVIVFAQYILAVLACSLTCSGNVAGAFLAFFGGSGVLFFIFFRIVRGLFKTKAKKDKTPDDNKSLNKKTWKVVGILALAEGLLIALLALFNN
jgi:uncharacterized membrane protein